MNSLSFPYKTPKAIGGEMVGVAKAFFARRYPEIEILEAVEPDQIANTTWYELLPEDFAPSFDIWQMRFERVLAGYVVIVTEIGPFGVMVAGHQLGDLFARWPRETDPVYLPVHWRMFQSLGCAAGYQLSGRAEGFDEGDDALGSLPVPSDKTAEVADGYKGWLRYALSYVLALHTLRNAPAGFDLDWRDDGWEIIRSGEEEAGVPHVTIKSYTHSGELRLAVEQLWGASLD